MAKLIFSNRNTKCIYTGALWGGWAYATYFLDAFLADNDFVFCPICGTKNPIECINFGQGAGDRADVDSCPEVLGGCEGCSTSLYLDIDLTANIEADFGGNSDSSLLVAYTKTDSLTAVKQPPDNSQIADLAKTNKISLNT